MTNSNAREAVLDQSVALNLPVSTHKPRGIILLLLLFGVVLWAVRPHPSGAIAHMTGSLGGLHVSGHRIVNTTGQTVYLHGVNRSGPEYACVENTGIFDGPSTEASVRAMASWHINAVRLPLNEDCWLGINIQHVNRNFVGAAYRSAIVRYVRLLNRYRMVALLNLHESAPGHLVAASQQPMPDADHSPNFWSSVALTFRNSTMVIFDLFDEPFPDNDRDTAGAWTCWKLGGQGHGRGSRKRCPDVTYRDAHDRDTGVTYRAASMQSLVNAVRATGARQMLLLDGVQYSDSLSHWLKNMPRDPLHNLAASWHPYNFNTCADTPVCWNTSLASVTARVPLVAGEIGEDDCSHTYIDRLMRWLDGHGASYLAWSWNDTYGKRCRPNRGPNGDISVIADYRGTPFPGMGVGYKTHLTCLAAGGCSVRDHLARSGSAPRSPLLLPPPQRRSWTLSIGIRQVGSVRSQTP